MNRDAFLARVRSAAQAGGAYSPRIRTDLPAQVGYVGAGDDPCGRLVEEVRRAGGNGVLAAGLEEARSALADLLRPFAGKTALRWRHPLLDRLDLACMLESLGMTDLHHASLAPLAAHEQRARMLSADVGISSCLYAIAESGTLVVDARLGQERCATLLPPVHVAVVVESQVLADLHDFFATLSHEPSGQLPSNITLITGPSKTGDIELQLTTGVHGPGTVHVIVIQGL